VDGSQDYAAIVVSLRPGEVCLGSVDDFEARRRADIESRERALPPREQEASTGETRQWSHRSGGQRESRGGGGASKPKQHVTSNPLFSACGEADRRRLLETSLETAGPHLGEAAMRFLVPASPSPSASASASERQSESELQSESEFGIEN